MDSLPHSVFGSWNPQGRLEIEVLMRSDPIFAPFIGPSMSNALLDFLILEKHHLFLESGTRRVLNESGEVISGYGQVFTFKDDAYHPQNFYPFNLKAVWVPETEGELFMVDPLMASPFIRLNPQGLKEFLFLVHPKSEDLFRPLLEAFAHTLVEIPCLSLSSFRTLLVSLPHPNGRILATAKVSLDEQITNASRIISRKEAAGSVATTLVFKNRLHNMFEKGITSLQIMEDIISFVPNSRHVAESHNHHPDRGASMIVRQVHPIFQDLQTNQRIVPLFCLLGLKNQSFFNTMVAKSNRTHSQFLCEKIFSPYAKILLELLFSQRISIEAHGQNLLLIVDVNTLQPIKGSEFLYRDMGGANALLTNDELAFLPPSLGKTDFFYFSTHHADAGTALEDQFVKKILFNLTKQMIKSKTSISCREFREWRLKMASTGHLPNWTRLTPDQPFWIDNEHEQDLTVGTYMNYGFAERKFAQILIKEIGLKFPNHAEYFQSDFLPRFELPLPFAHFAAVVEACFNLLTSTFTSDN